MGITKLGTLGSRNPWTCFISPRLLMRGAVSVGRILYFKDNEPQYSLLNMIFDRKKREEIFNHFDSKYQEIEEENEIFRMMTRSRKNRREYVRINSTTK